VSPTAQVSCGLSAARPIGRQSNEALQQTRSAFTSNGAALAAERWCWADFRGSRLLTARVATLLLVLALLGCGPRRLQPVFERNEASATIRLDLTGVTTLIVASANAPDSIQNAASEAGVGELAATMVCSVDGYFLPEGAKVERFTPSPPDTWFKAERDGSTLTMTSAEWIHIHHSCFFSRLAVTVPEGVEVQSQKRSYEDLLSRSR